MKIRRFVKKRRRRELKRLSDAMSSCGLDRDGRAIIFANRRWFVVWRELPVGLLEKCR